MCLSEFCEYEKVFLRKYQKVHLHQLTEDQGIKSDTIYYIVPVLSIEASFRLTLAF